MKLHRQGPFWFDRFFPIYNWIYPATAFKPDGSQDVRDHLKNQKGVKSRALYFHIPFCDTICSFCPFVRGAGFDRDTVERYVNALIAEINLLGPSLCNVPIGAIFFGGGTPSYLNPDQISRLGAAITRNFDLSSLREFSFEFEVKSADADTVAAAKSIGVTHARFGLQTFSPQYRDLFNITASLEQTFRAVDEMKAQLPFVSCDLIYGMHAQTPDQLIVDLENWCDLGISNLDLYPINNASIQRKLADQFGKLNMTATSGQEKFYLNQMARAWLAENGYFPHNGHGYVQAKDLSPRDADPITRSYSFCYHEHVYGYEDYDLFGFGVNAISSSNGFRVQNPTSMTTYMAAIENGEPCGAISQHSRALDAARPIALKLPYGGFVDRGKVDWDAMPDETRERLDRVLEARLVRESQSELQITRDGWDNYSNLMYFLSPASERRSLQAVVANAVRHGGRNIGDMRVSAY